MEHEVGDGGIGLLVGIVVGNIFGDQVVQLDGIAAGEIHDVERRGHDLGEGCNIVLGSIVDLHVMHLVGIGEEAEVLAIDDGSLVGHHHCPSGHHSLIYEKPEEIVQLSPVRHCHHRSHQQQHHQLSQHRINYNPPSKCKHKPIERIWVKVYIWVKVSLRVKHFNVNVWLAPRFLHGSGVPLWRRVGPLVVEGRSRCVGGWLIDRKPPCVAIV